MDKLLGKVKEYLVKMGVSEDQIEESKSGVTANFKIQVEGEEEGLAVEIPVSFFELEDWINCFSILLDLSKIPKNVCKEDLFISLLRANMSIPEVNFGIIGNYLGVYAWIHSSALTYENFLSEVNGILNGAIVFATKILPGFPELHETLSE
ncbi:MAG: hypothetical protein DRJ52_02820 [Thermoprotei archaeon]|nr:MAG: hypothetical protein DRJ52_02820 [Thermoprotei archaeon]HDI74409.1 hypothetical protein [Thermoprotei archaeon]